jgi:uncharacterized membrane-anchored protein
MRQMRTWAVAGAIAGGWMLAHAAPTEAERRQVWDDVGKAALKGPVDVPLAGQAVLHVPEGEVFVPQPQADRMLNMMGNPGNDPAMQGVLLPRDRDADWFMPVRFEKSGYVKDDDAKHWDADEMLDSFRKGTAEANEERRKQGEPELEIVGWAEKPRYDAATQRLVWAMASRDVGAKPGDPQGVNYNTYALGRDGYFSLNMVTGLSELPALKPVAAQQLAALSYNPGKRYADFDDKTDHVAEYGLAALVVGVAAHKLGFLALAGVFLAKFAKIIFVALAVFGGSVAKFFKRKPKTETPPQP